MIIKFKNGYEVSVDNTENLPYNTLKLRAKNAVSALIKDTKKSVNDISVTNASKTLDMIKRDFPDLIKSVQGRLNNSKSKQDDYNILYEFWWFGLCEKVNDLYNKQLIDEEEYNLYNEIFTDENATLPMPASVQKQILTGLFNIKNINLLEDLGIDEGVN